MDKISRNLLDEIKKYFDRPEIIAIKGPRQSGKSTLIFAVKKWLIDERKVKEENIIMLDFEDLEILQKFTVNTKEYFKFITSNKEGKIYVFIDEAQYCKEIGQKLKLIHDTHNNVKIVITGSSSLELTSQTGAYLVGRMLSFELFPFNFYEFLKLKEPLLLKEYAEKKDMVKEFILGKKYFKPVTNDFMLDKLLTHLKEYLVFGGYPEVVKSNKEEEKKMLLKNLFNTYVEKDIMAYLQITDSIKFSKLVNVLSSINAGLLSYEKISSACNSYFKETVHLIDILQQTYIIKILRPFYKSLVSELRKNPKVYFIDLGLRNYAINNFNSIEIRDDAGKLAENFVLNELSLFSPLINYWRTTSKSEIDFTIEHSGEIIPIECKFESMKKPKIPRSFYGFIEIYKPSRAIIFTKDFWGETTVKNTKIAYIPLVYA